MEVEEKKPIDWKPVITAIVGLIVAISTTYCVCCLGHETKVEIPATVVGDVESILRRRCPPEPINPEERVAWLEQIVDRRLEYRFAKMLEEPVEVEAMNGQPKTGSLASILVSFVYKTVKAVITLILADLAWTWKYVIGLVVLVVVSFIAIPSGFFAGRMGAKGK